MIRYSFKSLVCLVFSILLFRDVVHSNPVFPDFSKLYSLSETKVVSIYTIENSPKLNKINFTEINRSQVKQLGSGFIISSKCHIITNSHVIQGKGAIWIKMGKNMSLFSADLLGFDNDFDLAVLKINGKKGCPYLKWSSQKPKIGEWIYTIGNPLGIEQSLSIGVIGGLGRITQSEKYDYFHQVSAPLNPGNSGGPVINTREQVVGVVTQKAVGARVEGIAFALPAHLAKKITEDIKEFGFYERVALGVSVKDWYPTEKDLKALPKSGVLVEDVASKSVADKMGMQNGDIILQVDGKDVPNKQTLAYMLNFVSDKSIKIDFYSSNNKKRVQKIFKESRFIRPVTFAKQTLSSISIGASLITYDFHRHQSQWKGSGVLVKDLKKKGLLFRGNMREGDIISRVNGERVSNVRDLIVLLSQLKGKKVSLDVVRNSSEINLNILIKL